MGYDLSGKRALVTGGGTGIGYAIALELAREGVSVAITGRRSEVLDAAAQRVKDETGADVLAVVADTGDDESVRGLVATVASAFGGIDILVNNAAEQPAQHGPSYTDADDEWFARQINVKVIGYLRTIRAVAPLMIENKWGRIINISGTGSRQTVSVIGSVRNASVTALTKNVADELGKYGINVTVVHPGATEHRACRRASRPGPHQPGNPRLAPEQRHRPRGRAAGGRLGRGLPRLAAQRGHHRRRRPRRRRHPADSSTTDTAPHSCPREITVTDSPSATLSAKELHELLSGSAEFALIDVREPRVTAEQGSILLAASAAAQRA